MIYICKENKIWTIQKAQASNTFVETVLAGWLLQFFNMTGNQIFKKNFIANQYEINDKGNISNDPVPHYKATMQSPVATPWSFHLVFYSVSHFEIDFFPYLANILCSSRKIA